MLPVTSCMWQLGGSAPNTEVACWEISGISGVQNARLPCCTEWTSHDVQIFLAIVNWRRPMSKNVILFFLCIIKKIINHLLTQGLFIWNNLKFVSRSTPIFSRKFSPPIYIYIFFILEIRKNILIGSVSSERSRQQREWIKDGWKSWEPDLVRLRLVPCRIGAIRILRHCSAT